MKKSEKKAPTFRWLASLGEKYRHELKYGRSAKTGEVLTEQQRAYRAGYLDARENALKVIALNKQNQKKGNKKK